MAVYPAALVLHVSDTDRAAEFWSRALGYARQQDEPDFLVPPTGEGLRLHLDEDDRTHLDLWVDRELSDLESEVDRLVALGATRVDWVYPDDADFVVLADTEGNLFCVIK
jgi:catechol 2,3-dioxygenase-like lactoylglutathione lyase family enzyme